MCGFLVVSRVSQMKEAKQTNDVTWRFGPGYIELKHLYLVGLRHVDKGSFEPILEVHRHRD